MGRRDHSVVEILGKERMRFLSVKATVPQKLEGPLSSLSGISGQRKKNKRTDLIFYDDCHCVFCI